LKRLGGVAKQGSISNAPRIDRAENKACVVVEAPVHLSAGDPIGFDRSNRVFLSQQNQAPSLRIVPRRVFQACVQIAARWLYVHIRTQRTQQDSPPQTGGPHHSALR